MLIGYRTCEEGARAAKRLMAWGFKFERVGGDLRFEPEPLRNAPQHLPRIVELSKDYAAIMEVQPYSRQWLFGLDAIAMFQLLREIAVYETFPQKR